MSASQFDTGVLASMVLSPSSPDLFGVIFAAQAADTLLMARTQMAFTLGSHIILACFGVGMPVLMLAAEWRAMRTGDSVWLSLAKRWSKAFAVMFAMGAVSGTVLSFELGLLWPTFMSTYGSVIAMPFTLEGYAFFLEGIFVGIYLYGWDRLSPRAHWYAGVPIAISGAVSAWFVVTANAWMNVPRGFEMVDGKVIRANPIAAMLNPATGAQTTHMILAAYMVTGFCVAAFYAAAILRGKNTPYHRRGLGLALCMATITSCLQMVAGDSAARTVAQTQPIKLAAMEGQFKTERRAPLRIGGLPDPAEHVTRYALEIPGGLSFLAYHDINAEVVGLDAFPVDDQPPVPVVHLAFQVMVGLGTFMLFVALCMTFGLVRHRAIPTNRWLLGALVVCGPASVLALEAGWVVTEVGRQPWVVHGYARTADMVTQAPGMEYLLAATLTIYGLLAIGLVVILRRLAALPLEENSDGA